MQQMKQISQKLVITKTSFTWDRLLFRSVFQLLENKDSL
jgi:hypothetical protein